MKPEMPMKGMDAGKTPDTERPKEAGERKGQEQIDRVALEALMTRFAERVNEGNNGVIFALPIERLNDAAKRVLARLRIYDPEKEVEQVVKLLKVGTPGMLEKEYALLRKSYDAVHPKHVANPDGYADIPMPRYYATHDVNASFKDKFLDLNEIQVPDQSVEIMVMDRIDGTDVDTIMLREFHALNENSPLHASATALEGHPHGQIEELAARTLACTYASTSTAASGHIRTGRRIRSSARRWRASCAVTDSVLT
ncbi:MAG: hypothetical protein V1745_02630 [Patescibacteria group bacterium]